MTTQFNFQKKRFLITGASSGIGQATAQLLSQSNARVVALSRDENKLAAMIQQLHNPDQHQYVSLDLSSAYTELPATLKKLATESGPFDGIFHCAGIASVRPIQIVSEKAIDEMFNITLKSALMLAKGFCQKGVRNETDQTSIVLMSSVAAITGQKGMSLYSASRASIDGAVRSLACELAPQKIRVNSVISGAVETPMHHKLTDSLPKESIDDYENKHLLGFGKPEDIAQAVLFLLSESSKWITGTALVVDGGYSCV